MRGVSPKEATAQGRSFLPVSFLPHLDSPLLVLVFPLAFPPFLAFPSVAFPAASHNWRQPRHLLLKLWDLPFGSG